METMLRHWTLLRAVPRAPRKADAGALTARLREEGFDVSKRTVERDLRKLSGAFPLTNDEAPLNCGWFWPPDSEILDIPGMEPESALTLCILERFAAPLLPGTVLRRLDPQLQRARGILEALPEHAGPKVWPDRVRVLPRTIDLHAPEIEPDVIECVYHALFDGRRLEGEYRPRVAGGATTKTYDINPLALVFRDQVAYLVCTLWHYDDIRQLALHRFEAAQVLDRPRAEPERFDLDEYIAAGHFHIRETAEPLALRLRLASANAYHLYETALAEDQCMTPLPGGWVELTATVHDTAQLRWWLLGFGAGAEVVEPATLRAEFEEKARCLADLYGV